MCWFFLICLFGFVWALFVLDFFFCICFFNVDQFFDTFQQVFSFLPHPLKAALARQLALICPDVSHHIRCGRV